MGERQYLFINGRGVVWSGGLWWALWGVVVGIVWGCGAYCVGLWCVLCGVVVRMAGCMPSKQVSLHSWLLLL